LVFGFFFLFFGFVGLVSTTSRTPLALAFSAEIGVPAIGFPFVCDPSRDTTVTLGIIRIPPLPGLLISIPPLFFRVPTQGFYILLFFLRLGTSFPAITSFFLSNTRDWIKGTLLNFVPPLTHEIPVCGTFSLCPSTLSFCLFDESPCVISPFFSRACLFVPFYEFAKFFSFDGVYPFP